MPLNLPGLFSFTTGVDSAINQQNNRAIASGNEALAFTNQLNAFNQSLNTNDNLEFRRGFANQPQGTSILDRFSNIAAQTNNPFALNQAVLQQQSLAPLLALSAQQNPFFGAAQGLPTTAQGALDNGLLGFQPQFQQQYNAQLQQLLATQNPATNPGQVATDAGQAQIMALENQRVAQAQQAERDLREQNRRLQEALTRQLRTTNANTPARTVSTSSLAPINLLGPVAN